RRRDALRFWRRRRRGSLYRRRHHGMWWHFGNRDLRRLLWLNLNLWWRHAGNRGLHELRLRHDDRRGFWWRALENFHLNCMRNYPKPVERKTVRNGVDQRRVENDRSRDCHDRARRKQASLWNRQMRWP